MEGFPKPRSESEKDTEPAARPEEIEPVLKGLQEKLEEARADSSDEYELSPDRAAELSDTLKDIQPG